MSKVILFQGDSVTDANRGRDANTFETFLLGAGYPHLVAAELGADNPGEYQFFNRGISGNRIVDVYARIKADIINLKPDVMSILIGINDVWHEVNYQNGVDAQKFGKIYRMMIEEIKAALPNIKIIVMEPFMVHGRATDSTEEHPGRFEKMLADTRAHAEVAKEVAREFGLTFLPLQDLLTAAAEKAAPGEIIVDGVHPNAAGHELIKREWLKAFNSLGI